MKKQDTLIDWSIEAEEQIWLARQEAVEEQEEIERANKVAHRKEQQMALLLIAIFLLLGAGWLWQRQHPATETARELQSALDDEISAQKVQRAPHGDDTARSDEWVSSIVENATDSEATLAPALGAAVHMVGYRRLGDRVMAQVTVDYPVEGEMHAYRETRFYQKRADKWLRIGPDPTLLGAERTLQIAHFVILYKAVDANVIYETTPKLAQLYTKLRRDLGLPVAEASASYTIEVVTDRIPVGYTFNFANRAVAVPSPTLLSAPAEIPTTAVLYQSMIMPLIHKLMDDLGNQRSHKWQRGFRAWQGAVAGLRLWLLWQDGGPLTVGREELVRWAFENAQALDARAYKSSPNGYERMCRAYRIWGILPWAASIPLGCTDLDEQLPYPTSSDPMQPLSYPVLPEGMVGIAFSNPVLCETIYEYMMSTYGIEPLHRLVVAYGEHATLGTLIPAVFGVSANEFERGWRQFITTHYGVAFP